MKLALNLMRAATAEVMAEAWCWAARRAGLSGRQCSK